MEEILARRSTARASTTPPGCPSRCWRACTSSSGSTAEDAVPDVDPAGDRGPAGRRDAVWDDDFADALVDQCGARRPRSCQRRYERGVPRGLQGGLPGAPRPSPTCTGSRRCTSEGDIDLSLYTPPGAAPERAPLQGVPASASRSPCRWCCRGCRRWASRSSTSGRTRSSAPAAPPRGSTTSGCATSRRATAARSDAREPLPGRVRRRLGGRGGERRLQRAGAAGRADLAPGDGAARLREVPAPGRVDVQPGLHRGVPDPNVHIARLLVRLFEARFDPGVRDRRGRGRRRAAVEEIAGALDAVESLDQDRILRSFLGADPGHAAHQLLPARRRRPARRRTSPSSSTRSGARPARSRGRSSRSGSTARASRACTCASARSRAVACAGRTGARTSAPRCSAWSRRRWSRTPSSCRSAPRAASSSSARRRRPVTRLPTARPAGRGHRLLPDVHRRPARHHRQPIDDRARR